MKKLFCIALSILMLLGLAACGGSESAAGSKETTKAPASGFQVGYARVDVTPTESVPMGGYGNSLERMSTGMNSYLYLNVLALNDGTNTLLLLSIDHGWFGSPIGTPIIKEITEKFGIPEEYILMQGTHTHAGPDTSQTEDTNLASYNTNTVQLAVQAVDAALEDLKPAEIYVGSVETQNMNFVRRYIMDDGSLIGDNYPGTGTKIVSHETEADNEMQLMKFVREGGEDVLVMNFQAHPQLETRSTNLSGQTPYFMRDSVEKRLGIKTTYWQGAAGNINSTSRIESEIRTDNRVEYGEIMADYVEAAYHSMEKVNAGPIQVIHEKVTCKVDHSEDHLVSVATEINSIWKSTNSTGKAMAVAGDSGIASVYHASAILTRAGMGDTKDIPIAAFSFGDVGGVVVPYEMFDTSGMQIKSGSPFARTFIFGYARPGSFSYMPDAEAYKNIGYEGNQCRYVPGTAEQLVDEYLGMLESMHGK